MLIVEDDELVTRMLVRTLKKLAPSPRCERETQGAYDALDTERFDVVWSDLDLGTAVDGIDILEQAQRTQPHALLLIVSGNLHLVARRTPPAGTRVFAKSQVDAAVECVRAHAESLGFVIAK